MNMPLMVDLAGQRIVIVGGGQVAARRASNFIDYCQDIHIISPQVHSSLEYLINAGQITWHQKEFDAADIAGAFLVVAATNNKAVNQQVKALVPPGCLFNNAEDATSGNVTIPNILKRGKLTLSVATQGASPKLGIQIIEQLSHTYDERYEQYVEFLYQCRQTLKRINIEPSYRQALLAKIVSDDYLDLDKQQAFLGWLQAQAE
ncbi:NAD(P)-binding protein [Staphylococcus lugdunensis]|uniref:NAD(P)-binding protein n=1 Tax=Staphylococcus TaxID=1279 RepID=UPI0008A182EB|nr:MULTISPECIES: NAD(P)-binding protein [Staphylococcus]ARJ13018.1 precorrin-2 dehydrogenase [Staphylococcus lugdunensis]MCH8665194.1 NAD(P)-binding protein [Staphylococcus lugdunensis]OFJ63300.1 precorrin-2 dehydrogenase [Staphylococcus sp. HMSC077E11]OFM45444.1 precorrin-2 dehydrogenase [Staphylococcus sp. HMSC077E12]OFR88764.1 precorrin-2 dehydrogenase [Staphylococcus sp. HMSC059F04]